jgi:NAD(P)-dependent dehydrogenase (short-subunit alcohol dehydrogenase family)
MSKTILITGASRGIGCAAALLAGRRGWSVGVNYVRDEASALAVVKEIQRSGGKAVALHGDVAFEADVIEIFEGATRALGPLDGVVVNAGIVAPGSHLADMSVERMKRVFDTNVLGAYVCAREAARRLSKSRGGAGGSIVLISSAAARIGGAGEYVDYAGSKGAIDTLTLGLAKELGPEGVRQRHSPGPDRDRHPRQRRRARPRAKARRHRPARAPRPARQGRRGDRLAAQRHRVLHQRRDPRCDGRALERLSATIAQLRAAPALSRLLPPIEAARRAPLRQEIN